MGYDNFWHVQLLSSTLGPVKLNDNSLNWHYTNGYFASSPENVLRVIYLNDNSFEVEGSAKPGVDGVAGC